MKNMLVAASIAAAFAGPAFAETFVDSAPVLSVRAITERTPVNREECWSEQRRGYEERRVTRQSDGAPIGPGTVLGAIIGGVAGHQVGSGRGKDAATAGGAIIGGLIGNQVDRDQGRVGPGSETVEVERRPVTREVERCRTVQDVREVPVGYDVRYRYGNREFVTRLPYDPGRRIRIAVDVRVAEDGGPPAPQYRR
jgi:uncharacterized protein YcfJ